MSVRFDAERNILKRKLKAEQLAESRVNEVLKDENARLLFMKAKQLVVEIAKLDVAGESSREKREEYNKTRELMAELLKEIGVDKSELRPKYTCDKCKDTGYQEGKVMCDCLIKEMSIEFARQNGIDIDNLPKFSDDYSIFDNPKKVKLIYEKMQKFVEELDTTQIDTVLLFGDTGVGKTYLMQCMMSYAVSLCKQVKFVTAFNFNQDMLKYHCASLDEKSIIMEDYLNAEILFIDDLGTENKINNVTCEYLYSVINDRLAKHKKTVISTNLDFAQIQEVYGERIFSRLMHKKQGLRINFEGCDLRLKK